MRALDRLISFIFSVIMLVVAIILILVGTGVVEAQMIMDMLKEHVFVQNLIDGNIWNVLTITGIVLLLASLKTTIFLSLFKVKDKSPILVKTQNGEVEIAQETITSTVRNVGLSFENIKDVQAKMVKKNRGVIIYAMLLVYADSNIREITEAMQQQVKEVIKSTTGVNVIEVNIKVKNIYAKQKYNEEATKDRKTTEKSENYESKDFAVEKDENPKSKNSMIEKDESPKSKEFVTIEQNEEEKTDSENEASKMLEDMQNEKQEEQVTIEEIKKEENNQ